MGIKTFSKLFAPTKTIKSNELAELVQDKTIAVDAMCVIYRAILGMNNLNSLTAPDGASTNHIYVLFHIILNFRKTNTTQIWVFDNTISPKYKKQEGDKRKAVRTTAQQKLQNTDIVCKNKDLVEKQAFVMTTQIIQVVKLMLDQFVIQYLDAPQEFEAECICAYLTKINKCPEKGSFFNTNFAFANNES